MDNKNNDQILRKEKNKSKTHINKNLTRDKGVDSSHSTKSNNIIHIHNFDKVYLNRDAKSYKNLVILSSKYKKDLFEKFSEFLKINLNYLIILMKNIQKNF